MTFNYTRNSSLIGTGLITSATGVHDFSYSQLYSTPFPVINPELQWQFDVSSMGLVTNSTYNNSFSFESTDYGQGTNIWRQSSGNSQVLSYNKAGSTTGQMLSFSAGSNVGPVDSSGNAITSYNGDIIRSNQGYTTWAVISGPSASTGWQRVMWYLGTGNNNTSATTPQTSEFSNITIFSNFGTSGAELRVGTVPGITSHSSYFQTSTHTFNSTNHIRICVFVYNPATWDTTPQTDWFRIKYAVYDQSTTSWLISPSTTKGTQSTTTSAGVRTGTGGRPILGDSTYFTQQNLRLINAGFANRPYSSLEVDNLFSWLAFNVTGLVV